MIFCIQQARERERERESENFTFNIFQSDHCWNHLHSLEQAILQVKLEKWNEHLWKWWLHHPIESWFLLTILIMTSIRNFWCWSCLINWNVDDSIVASGLHWRSDRCWYFGFFFFCLSLLIPSRKIKPGNIFTLLWAHKQTRLTFKIKLVNLRSSILLMNPYLCLFLDISLFFQFKHDRLTRSVEQIRLKIRVKMSR